MGFNGEKKKSPTGHSYLERSPEKVSVQIHDHSGECGFTRSQIKTKLSATKLYRAEMGTNS